MGGQVVLETQLETEVTQQVLHRVKMTEGLQQHIGLKELGTESDECHGVVLNFVCIRDKIKSKGRSLPRGSATSGEIQAQLASF